MEENKLDINTISVGTVESTQHAIIYDLLSEGPIEGIVGGASGIYLNGTPLVSTYNANLVTPKRSNTGVFNSGNTTVTSTGLFSLVTGTPPILLERGKANSTVFAGTAGSTRITAAGFFTTAMFTNANFIEALNPKIRITGLGPEGAEYIGKLVTFIDVNTAEVTPSISTTGSGKSGGVDLVTTIVSNSANTAVVAAAPSVSGTGIQVLSNPFSSTSTVDDRWNFKNVWASFRSGRRDQQPILIEGVPTASYLTAINQEIKWTNTFGGNQAAISYSASQLGIAVPGEIDKLKFTLAFPSGLYINGGASGNKKKFYVGIQLVFSYTQGGVVKDVLLLGPRDSKGPNSFPTFYGTGRKVPDWTNWFDANPSGAIIRQAMSSFVEEIIIPIEQFKPFTNFSIKLSRVNPDDTNNYQVDDATLFSSMVLKDIECQIIDKFSYPYSAYSTISFPADGFSSPPTRAYDTRGLKIQVPSNYTTREETGSVATYSGAWNGTFRTVYCNNPAWVFYDLATNRRYGLGQYIDSAYVNKYALYSIARYCDELVSDGKGGLEPRFTCNAYLFTTEEAYKVLRDLATTFRGLLYWMDGQLIAVQDRPKEPVYNFSQGNIIGGVFFYEYTGNLTRYNTVNVTWNNPDQFYAQDVITVTDATDIAKKNKIISMDTLAFGCTSVGQAYRVGNWNLIVSQTETEIIKFKTAINAGFLRPGDIINVQDQHEYAVQASGRIKSAANTTNITFDRQIYLAAGSSYYLHLVYDGPGCYLQQATANVSGTVYVTGDYIPGVLTEAAAATLLDTSGNLVATSFSPNVRVEKKPISTTLPYTGNTVTVSSGFSSTANSENMWVVENITLSDNMSPKKYRILGIAEEEEHTYSIVASIYVTDKYSELEKKTKIKAPNYIGPRQGDSLPPVTNIMAQLFRRGDINFNEFQGYIYDATISWDSPTETYIDSSGVSKTRTYPYLSRYEIQHNLTNLITYSRDYESKIISSDASSIVVPDVTAGTYTVKVRMINTSGQYSAWVTKSFELTTKGREGGGNVLGLKRGGTVDSAVLFDSNTFTVTDSDYVFTSEISSNYIVTAATANQSSQSFSSLSANTIHYLMWDSSDTADPWKAVSIYSDTVVSSPVGAFSQYWINSNAANNGMTQLGGTITVSTNTNKITGVSTTFIGNVSPGNLIKLGSGNTAYYASVSSVTSNTELYTAEIVQKAFTAQTISKQAIDIDYTNDTIAAKILVNSSNVASLQELYLLTSANEAKLIALSVTSQTFSFNGNGTLIGPSDIVFSVNRQNITSPIAWTLNDSLNNSLVPGGYLTSISDAGATLTAVNFNLIPDNSFITVGAFAEGFSDVITIHKLVQGTDGKVAHTIVLTQEAVLVPSDYFGNATSYANTGTTIYVYAGNIPVGTDNVAPYAVTTFRVTGVTGTGITANPTIVYGPEWTQLLGYSYYATIGNHSNMTAESATVTITIKVEDSVGVTTTYRVFQSLRKSRTGAQANTNLYNQAGTLLKDIDIRNDSLVTNALSSLNANPTFEIPRTNPDGTLGPASWWRWNTTASIRYADDNSRDIVRLPLASGIAIVGAALRCNPLTQYEIVVNAALYTGGTGGTLVIDVNEYDGDLLPYGKRAFMPLSGASAETEVMNGTRTTASSSYALTYNYAVYTYTYTPSKTAKWFSPEVYVVSDNTDQALEWVIVREKSTIGAPPLQNVIPFGYYDNETLYDTSYKAAAYGVVTLDTSQHYIGSRSIKVTGLAGIGNTYGVVLAESIGDLANMFIPANRRWLVGFACRGNVYASNQGQLYIVAFTAQGTSSPAYSSFNATWNTLGAADTWKILWFEMDATADSRTWTSLLIYGYDNWGQAGVPVFWLDAIMCLDVTDSPWITVTNPPTTLIPSVGGNFRPSDIELARYSRGKLTTTSRINNATLTDDPDLQGIILDANTQYKIEAVLPHYVAASADLKFQFYGTAAFSSFRGRVEFANAGAGIADYYWTNNVFVRIVNSTEDALLIITGTLITGAATTLSFQWAQILSGGGAVQFYAGGYLKATKIR